MRGPQPPPTTAVTGSNPNCTTDVIPVKCNDSETSQFSVKMV